MRSSHVIAILDVNSTVAYLVDIVVASPYTGLLVSERWAPGPPFPFIKAPYIYHYTPTKALSLPKLRSRD